METYWIVYLNNGKTSGPLSTVPDLATFIEDNVDPETVSFVTIRRQKRDREKIKKEIAHDIEKVERRLNDLKAKQKLLNGK